MQPLPFARLPVIDGHVHFVHPDRMDDILSLLEAAGCQGANLVSLPERDGTTQNLAALLFKQRRPEHIYICGALEYQPALADPERASQILASQVQALKQRGFDGLKLIEGKPEVRKLLPLPLDGAAYAGMWAALEREAFPAVVHLADPDEFWSASECPGWARQNGWDYSDGSYPSKEDLYGEMRRVLARHPGLTITLAHFGFLSGDLDGAAQFLDAYPQVCFDLAPHIGMYHDFSRSPSAARDFFLRYPDRIIYGTDLDTRPLARGEAGRRWMASIPYLVRSCLERCGAFEMPDGSRYHGLGLPEEALKAIYHTNFTRVFGLRPARLKDESGEQRVQPA